MARSKTFLIRTHRVYLLQASNCPRFHRRDFWADIPGSTAGFLELVVGFEEMPNDYSLSTHIAIRWTNCCKQIASKLGTAGADVRTKTAHAARRSSDGDSSSSAESLPPPSLLKRSRALTIHTTIARAPRQKRRRFPICRGGRGLYGASQITRHRMNGWR